MYLRLKLLVEQFAWWYYSFSTRAFLYGHKCIYSLNALISHDQIKQFVFYHFPLIIPNSSFKTSLYL